MVNPKETCIQYRFLWQFLLPSTFQPVFNTCFFGIHHFYFNIFVAYVHHTGIKCQDQMVASCLVPMNAYLSYNYTLIMVLLYCLFSPFKFTTITHFFYVLEVVSGGKSYHVDSSSGSLSESLCTPYDKVTSYTGPL